MPKTCASVAKVPSAILLIEVDLTVSSVQHSLTDAEILFSDFYHRGTLGKNVTFRESTELMLLLETKDIDLFLHS